MDTVIHDGAPNVGGAWASEAYSHQDLQAGTADTHMTLSSIHRVTCVSMS